LKTFYLTYEEDVEAETPQNAIALFLRNIEERGINLKNLKLNGPLIVPRAPGAPRSRTEKEWEGCL